MTSALAGHILGEDVYAPQNVPLSKTTSVDGYALRCLYIHYTSYTMLMLPAASDPPGVYKVLTSKTHAVSDVLPAGSIFRINTGGPLPAGTDTVIMVEDTELVSTVKENDGRDTEEKEVKTLAQVPPGDNVREPGSDVCKGDLVLQRGEVITSLGGEVGTLAFVGRKEVGSHLPYVIAEMNWY